MEWNHTREKQDTKMTRKRTTENEMVVSGGAASAARRKASRTRAIHSATTAEPASAAALETAALSQTTSSVTAVEPSLTMALPAHDAIARLAYSYWEARGCQGGSPEEDWLRAEGEIRRLAVAVL